MTSINDYKGHTIENLYRSNASVESVLNQINKAVESQAISFDDGVKAVNYLFDISKSWSKQLESKFPNGGWKSINGASVFIDGGGKVVAGLDGFNKHIDKLHSKGDSGKKDGGSPKPKKEPKSTTPTLDTFRDLASGSKDAKDFVKQIREIKNVPSEVSQEFFDKYGGKSSSPEKAAEQMFNEVKGGKSDKEGKPNSSNSKQDSKPIKDSDVKTSIPDIDFSKVPKSIKEKIDENGASVADAVESALKELSEIREKVKEKPTGLHYIEKDVLEYYKENPKEEKALKEAIKELSKDPSEADADSIKRLVEKVSKIESFVENAYGVKEDLTQYNDAMKTIKEKYPNAIATKNPNQLRLFKD